jgi:hypothetical protein
LQARQHDLHRGGQVAIFQDELEQHADQIDGVLIDGGDMTGPLAAQRADLGQQLALQLQNFAAQLGGVVRLGVG